MEVLLRQGLLERHCRTASSREQAWGALAPAVGRRLFELWALASLADVALLPGVVLQADGTATRYRMRCIEGIEFILRPVRSGGLEPAADVDLRSLGTVVVEEVSLLPKKGGD